MNVRRVVLVALVVVGTVLALGAVFADGVWRDLWLNLLAEAFGAAFIVLFVDVLFERSRQRDRDERRRAAINELGYVLRELDWWLSGCLWQSETRSDRSRHTRRTGQPDRRDPRR